MKTLRFLLRQAPRMTVLTGAVSVLSGAFNGALLAVVHQTLQEADSSARLVALFVVVAIGKLVTGYASEVMLAHRAQQTVADVRLDLVRKLQRVPLREFERIGQARILSTLTDDVEAISDALFTLPAFAINLAVVGGAGAYLLYLSPVTLVVLAAFTGFGALVYRTMNRRAWGAIVKTREARDRLQGHFAALTHGVKELKLHRPRRTAFTEREIAGTTRALMDHTVTSHSRYILAHSTSHLLLIALIGVVVFILPGLANIDSATVSGYVLTALFLMGPMNGAANSLPVFSRATIAIERVSQLGIDLDAQATEQVSVESATQLEFRTIDLENVTFHFDTGGKHESFSVGPVSLQVGPGEILFVTGGNGSGKSTLGKILAGLYEPESGRIVWNGAAVDGKTRDEYRQLFSAVFSDFFLFESLIGLEAPGTDERAEQYLNALDLSHKVTVTGSQFSTTNLSQGQRKRLALLTAYLEDRPIYLFDEWAADQDPEFKEVFYRQLIPELKRRGKTIIVISHDDRYFDVADRCFVMREGQLEVRASNASSPARIQTG